MNRELRIKLLGGLTIEQDGRPVTGLVTRKAEVLVAYLVMERRPHAREMLATLLWDDRGQKQALSNLRTLLTSLRKHLDSYLTITRETVAWHNENIWVDVWRFEEMLAAAPDFPVIVEALSLYQGDFLEGVFVRESLGVEEWMIAIGERLRHQAVEAHFQLAGHYLHSRQYATGIRHAEEVVRLEPLRENGHRLLMRLLARDGQPNAALAQFERCRQVLDDELGVTPAAETITLYERISRAKRPSTPPLPPQLTTFVGRRDERAAIGRRLDNPACHLLTLVGAGGAGKTRLALEVAAERQGDYLNGVFFVPLADVTPSALAAVVAAALDLTLAGKTSVQKQLLDYLQNQEMLLILDNFEHLGDEGVALVQAVVETAPDVQVMVTSREQLHLQAEWLVPMTGLTFTEKAEHPVGGNGQSRCDAVQMFLACAWRVQPAFSLSGEVDTAVSQICRLVEGLPLAIELAAGALPQRPPAEINAQIQRNLDILATKMRDMPARHRSMRATFEYSWSLLTAEEQRFFQQLSVFRGGFTVEAAVAVTTADGDASSETLLTRLVTKSLLQHDGQGRYRLHELLRQYAAEKLAGAPRLEASALERHGRYYVNLLQDLHDDLLGLNMVRATAAVDDEIENMRQAWQQAVRRQDETAVAQALNSLYAFYATRCRYEEGVEMLAQAATMLAALPESVERNLLIARIWARQAKLCESTTFTGKAEQLYRQSLALFKAQGAENETGLPLQGLGYLAYMQGDNSQARQHLQASLAAFAGTNQPGGTAAALNTLAQVARRQGEFQEAGEVCRQGLEIRRGLGDLRGVASSLNILGLILAEIGDFNEALAALQESVTICRQLDNRTGLSNALANLVQVAFQLGDQEAAWRYAEEGLAVYRELGDYWGVAISLNNLGCLAEDQGDLGQARRLLQESVAIYREIGIRSGLATSLGNLGDVCVALEKFEEAKSCLGEGLRVAVEANDTPNTLLALSGIGYLLLATGDEDRALPLLAFVQEHPKNRPWTKKKAARRLAQIYPRLTAAKQAQIQDQSRSLLLDDLIQAFLTL